MVYPHAYRTEHSETHTSNSEYGDYYARVISKKIKIQPALLKILQHIDSNRKQILSDLNEFIKYKTVWPNPANMKEFVRTQEHIARWMRKLGAKFESFDIGYTTLGNQKVKLPPVTLATMRGTSNTVVLVYCHVDVKEPCPSKWKTNPWEAIEVGKAIYGNGVVQGKGALVCWLEVINAFNVAKVQLPVTVKFIIESNYYNRSNGLKDFLMTQKQNFLNDVSCVVVNNSEWLTEKYPCITYGVVGFVHLDVYVTTIPNSGEDPEATMEEIISRIRKDDEVTIPRYDKYVTQITPDEENLYESININFEEIKKLLPPERQSWTKSKLLMHYWRKPTIFVDKVERCTCDKRDSTKIKRHIILKIVPKQIPQIVAELMKEYIYNLAHTLKLKNKVDVEYTTDTKPWVEDCNSLNYEAARRATIQIYKEDPNMIRDDKDLKSLNILEMIEKNILIMPLSAKNSYAGQDNEHIPMKNLNEGIKLIAAYLFQIRLLSEGQGQK